MREKTITRVLEIRRILNEQFVQLLYVEPETEQDEKDLASLKGMLTGVRKALEEYAERLIRESKKS